MPGFPLSLLGSPCPQMLLVDGEQRSCYIHGEQRFCTQVQNRGNLVASCQGSPSTHPVGRELGVCVCVSYSGAKRSYSPVGSNS